MKFAYEASDAPATSSMEREIVPAGIHTMEIRHAEEGPNSWKECDQNPTGECLKLRLSVGDYRFIFDDIPQHLGWRAKQLATAFGFCGWLAARFSLEPEDFDRPGCFCGNQPLHQQGRQGLSRGEEVRSRRCSLGEAQGKAWPEAGRGSGDHDCRL